MDPQQPPLNQQPVRQDSAPLFPQSSDVSQNLTAPPRRTLRIVLLVVGILILVGAVVAVLVFARNLQLKPVQEILPLLNTDQGLVLVTPAPTAELNEGPSTEVSLTAGDSLAEINQDLSSGDLADLDTELKDLDAQTEVE